jgi:hypothetical protein
MATVGDSQRFGALLKRRFGGVDDGVLPSAGALGPKATRPGARNTQGGGGLASVLAATCVVPSPTSGPVAVGVVYASCC